MHFLELTNSPKPEFQLVQLLHPKLYNLVEEMISLLSLRSSKGSRVRVRVLGLYSIKNGGLVKEVLVVEGGYLSTVRLVMFSTIQTFRSYIDLIRRC